LPFWVDALSDCAGGDAYFLAIRHLQGVSSIAISAATGYGAKTAALWLLHNVPFFHELRESRSSRSTTTFLTQKPRRQLDRIERKLD